MYNYADFQEHFFHQQFDFVWKNVNEMTHLLIPYDLVT